VREAEAALKELGFTFSYARGSHHYWRRNGEIFTLPIHGDELKCWVTRELRKFYEEKTEK